MTRIEKYSTITDWWKKLSQGKNDADLNGIKAICHPQVGDKVGILLAWTILKYREKDVLLWQRPISPKPDKQGHLPGD